MPRARPSLAVMTLPQSLPHEDVNPEAADAPPRPQLLEASSPSSVPTLPQLVPRGQEGDAPPTSSVRLPPSNPTLRVLRHDPGRYLVVDKPADVRIDGAFTHTVERLALAHLAGGPDARARVRFVHRLDYATSGVLLLGLSRPAAGVAAAQFEARSARKAYVALVRGAVPGLCALARPIADAVPPGFRMAVGGPGNPGRDARTAVRPVAWGTYRGRPVTKVRLEPHTGRRHQLRVHCAHAGWPIVGDATYGGEAEEGPPRMMLHALELELRLPHPGRQLYGRKSALREAEPAAFVTEDPFVEARLEGLRLERFAEGG